MSVYKRILLAVDMSEDTPRIAQRARALADTFGAELHLLHVVEPMPLITPVTAEPMIPTDTQAQQQVFETMERRVTALAGRLQLPDSAHQTAMGGVKTEILRVARGLSADLIVLGSKERHGLSVLVDFTEDAVLHKAPCDVLAIRV